MRAINKYLPWAIILLLFISIQVIDCFAQTNIVVTAARDKIGAINVGSDSGIVLNQKYRLLRNENNSPIYVGIVRVVKVTRKVSGNRLIEEIESNFIAKGDRIGKLIKDDMKDFLDSIEDFEVIREDKKPVEKYKPKKWISNSQIISNAKLTSQKMQIELYGLGVAFVWGPLAG